MGIVAASQAIDAFVRQHSNENDQCFTLRIDGSWQQHPDSWRLM
jgi:hypothetical protein